MVCYTHLLWFRSERFFLLMALLIVALSSCLPLPLMPPPPPVQDESLAAGQPCLPPCWHDIYPGQTSANEAANIVEGLSFVDPGSVGRRTRDLLPGFEETIDWNYQYATHARHGGILYVRNGIIAWIRVFLPRTIRLSDVLAAQGQPELVSISMGMVQGEQEGYYISLFYPERGLMITSTGYPRIRDQHDVMLTGDILIGEAEYLAPTDIIGYYLVAGYGYSEEVARRVAQLWVPWPGLGEVVPFPPSPPYY